MHAVQSDAEVAATLAARKRGRYTGGKPMGAEIEACNDHRMVMSLAIAALFADGDTIFNGAEAVTKSYPGFFSDLARLGATIEELP